MNRLWRWAQVLVVLSGAVGVVLEAAFAWVWFFSNDDSAAFLAIVLSALIGYASAPLAVGIVLGIVVLWRTPARRSRGNLALVVAGTAVLLVAVRFLMYAGLI